MKQHTHVDIPVAPIPPPNLQSIPIINPVEVSSTTDSLPSLENDSPADSLNLFVSSPIPPQLSTEHVNSSLEFVSSYPYAFDIPSSSYLPDTPIQPKYRSFTDIYTASSGSAQDTLDPHVSPISHVFPNSPRNNSFANMVHSAETYREPATYKQATMQGCLLCRDRG